MTLFLNSSLFSGFYLCPSLLRIKMIGSQTLVLNDIIEYKFVVQTDDDTAKDTSDLMDEGETETTDNPPQHPLICLQDQLATAVENGQADCAINNKLKFIQVRLFIFNWWKIRISQKQKGGGEAPVAVVFFMSVQ